MTTVPLVSIVLPARNAARYVRAAVESMLHQTFSDFELLALDDGSSDATPEILATLAAHDSRVRVLRTDGKGLLATLNYGVDQARGKYVARMDADDIAFPNRLERQIGVLEANPEVGVLGAAIIVASQDLRPRYTVHYPVSDHKIRCAMAVGNPFAHPVVVMRKSAFERAGGYRPAFQHAEDYDLWLRMAEVSHLANLRDPLLYYRVHRNQVSMNEAQQQIVSVIGAQVAARARREGKEEPFQACQTVSLDDVYSSGREVVPDLLISVATSAAIQMTVIGEPGHALRLTDWARSALPGLQVAARPRARLHLSRAAAYWCVRDLGRCVKSAMLAWLADPASTAASVLSALQGWATATWQARASRSLLRVE